jgi:hypothetical protein
VAEARTAEVGAGPSRARSRAAAVFAAAYVVSLASFWIIGAVAYFRSGHGPSSLLGLAYFPILLLPMVGKGWLGALRIGSSIWLWWFALQMVLAIAAIWLYPYERPRRRSRRAMVRQREVSHSIAAEAPRI